MFLHGSIDGFLALTDHAASALARENQYLIAGPWLHIPWGDRIGAADFGPEALLDTDAILLRWFNHWLKDSGEFAGEPQIRHFVLGENRWREAAVLARAARSTRFYLHSEGRANSRKGDGELSTRRRLAPKSPATFSSTIPKCRCSRPAARRASRAIRPSRARTGQQCAGLHDRAAAAAAPRIRHAARFALLLDFRRATPISPPSSSA